MKKKTMNKLREILGKHYTKAQSEYDDVIVIYNHPAQGLAAGAINELNSLITDIQSEIPEICYGQHYPHKESMIRKEITREELIIKNNKTSEYWGITYEDRYCTVYEFTPHIEKAEKFSMKYLSNKNYKELRPQDFVDPRRAHEVTDCKLVRILITTIFEEGD